MGIVFFQVAIETIYVVVQTIVYTLLLYSIGYKWTTVKFLYFYYFIFMSSDPMKWEWGEVVLKCTKRRISYSLASPTSRCTE